MLKAEVPDHPCELSLRREELGTGPLRLRCLGEERRDRSGEACLAGCSP